MNAKTIIEQALTVALASGTSSSCPPRLAAAVEYAVFPGGARIRPRLSLAVARACHCNEFKVAAVAAASIELLHCASLVHDDMPCFDDADVRRGKPSVHKVYGESLALLTGDALIVLAFQNLGQVVNDAPQRLPQLLSVVSRGVGMPNGIVAGQAWECEPNPVLADYQRAKTGSLFAAATEVGAAAAGVESECWRELGERLGEAYQVADDIRDVFADAEDIGKPTGQDEALDRPNMAMELGLSGATGMLEQILAQALDSIPACPGESELRALIMAEAQEFLPKQLRQAA